MKNINNSAVKGIILLLLGVIFLMSNFDLINFNLYNDFFSNHLWVFLVATLLVLKRRSLIIGFAFFAIGILFVISDFGVIGAVNWGNVWPIFIIAAGFSRIFKDRLLGNLS